MIHFRWQQPEVSINLKNLKKELECDKITNHCPEPSFKRIALYLGLATLCIAPSCWDTGTDINQGQLYLNGDIYTKYVNNESDPSVMNCSLMETTRKVIGDIESNEEVIYTYECFEKDEYWGYLTLFFVFIFTGLFQVIYIFTAIASLETSRQKMIGYGISLGLIILMPLFPLQVILVKLFTFLTNGPEMKKISTLMIICEANFESQLQFLLQLYIIFTRADRQPSTSQMLSLSTSIFFMAKSSLESSFVNKPNEPLLKKLPLLPQKLCELIFWYGSYAILLSTFRITFFVIGLFTIVTFASCLKCICMKAKISQGEIWQDQKYKGITLNDLTLEAVFFITLPILLVMIYNFPDATIYSLDAAAIISSNSSDLIVQTKLSKIALVNENWANYVIPTILVAGVIHRVLSYMQITKAEKTIQISNKDDQQDIYEIPWGTLKDSPLDSKVVKVLVDEKTFIVPTGDLDIEKYPQESETKIMIKSSKEKDSPFKNLKKKVSCSVKDETAKPIKAYVVKIEDMKEIFIETPKQNITAP